METKAIRVSLINHQRLADIGHKNDSFNDIISKLLDEYEEYQQIKDLIEADKEFTNGEGVHFSSLDELEFKRSTLKQLKSIKRKIQYLQNNPWKIRRNN